MPQLRDFEGEWVLTRQIRHADGTRARFEGRARFTPEGAALRYHEQGALILPGGQRMQADRRYVWCAEGDGIAVFFDDGRRFHSFDPRAPQAAHWCDPDDYRVTYEFARWPEWRAQWRVRGPRKDYQMVSDYGRL